MYDQAVIEMGFLLISFDIYRALLSYSLYLNDITFSLFVVTSQIKFFLV